MQQLRPPFLSLRSPCPRPPLIGHGVASETLTRTLASRRSLAVRCRRSDYIQPQRLAHRPPEDDSTSSLSPQPPGAQPSRVYVGYSIYKGKAALTVEPRAPEFSPLDSGAFKVSKEGFIFLQFAPAVAARQYDWNRKQVFSLSVPEIGTLMSLGAKDSCEFFHDPFKGRSILVAPDPVNCLVRGNFSKWLKPVLKNEEGKIRKVLKAEPLPDGTGHFFNLSVQNRLLNMDESIYIPITKAEFAILNSTFNFILPYLLGWNTFANAIKPEDTFRSNNTTSHSGAELEWGR